MKITRPAAALLSAASTIAVPAWASGGQFDSFSANTTTVTAGGTVDFSALFSISTSASSGGGSNPTEPPPQEGYQVWAVNWYSSQAETVTGVQLQAAGETFNDFPTAAPGGSYSNSWSFSRVFPTAGTYDVLLTGSWTTLTESYISTETATRDCQSVDPGGTDQLFCSSWAWSYYNNTDSGTYESGFNPLSITIQVVAVPEPHAVALWLAGMGVLAALRRARR